ncbi:MAG: hypothetical protein A2X64_02300 [Ignavibacteria bacterium GWF2_33_9]|nr:MAG: hypothetical protein A2X64_02300 [Ignavibacteria bacterium GWF2_33_9]
MSINASSETFTVLKPKVNYPIFENQLFYFDDNFQTVDFNSSDLTLALNNNPKDIDSIIILNSSKADSINVFVAIELTSAFTNYEKKILSEYLDYLYSIYQLKKISLKIVFFNKNFLHLFDNNSLSLPSINDFYNQPFYCKPDLNKLIEFQSFSEFKNSESKKSLILITKSLPIIDVQNFSNILLTNSIDLININFSNRKSNKLSELSTLIQSYYLNLNDFSDYKDLFPTSIYLAFGGKPYKIFWNENLNFGIHSVNLIFQENESNNSFELFRNQIPTLYFDKFTLNFGIIDSGMTSQKTLRISSKNQNSVIKNIQLLNSDFQLLNFSPNLQITSEQPFDLKIQYESKSTDFTNTMMLIETTDGKYYKIFLQAGLKPKINETLITFFDSLNNKEIYEYEPFTLKWSDSYSLDTFKVDYKPSLDSNWINITKSATNNTFMWNIPRIMDSLIDIKVSQVANDLVSDKVILLKGHNKKITEISWSPNDSLIVTSSEDGTILLWDSKTGKQIKTLFQSQSKVISGVDWSSDGNYIVIAANDTLVNIWNVKDDILFNTLDAPAKVVKVKFLYNKQQVVTFLENGTILIWDIIDLKILATYKSGYFNINSFDINESLPFIAIGTEEGDIILWNFETDQVTDLVTLPTPVNSICFSPNGNNLAIASMDNKVRIYDINSKINVLTLFDVNGPIMQVNWLRNKKYIITTQGNFVKLWSPINGNLLEIYDQHNHLVYYLKSNHNGNLVSSIGEDNIVHIWSPFDSPFERPALISNEITQIKVLHKNLETPQLSFPNIQKGDTLYFYDNSFARNLSEFPVVADTSFLTSQIPNLKLVNPVSVLNLSQNSYIQSEYEFIPQDTLQQLSSAFIKSGSGKFEKSIHAFVYSKFFDRKVGIIDFGTLNLGEKKDSSFFALQNISPFAFNIDSVKFLSTIENTFSINNPEIPYSLEKYGGVFFPKISFYPKKSGISSGILRLFFKNSIPVDIQLIGNSVAPLLWADSEIEAGKIFCEKYLDTAIIIKNTGTSNLEILNIMSQQDQGTIIDNMSIDNTIIKPSDSTYFNLRIHSTKIGLNNIFFEIQTNTQSNLQSSNQIHLKFQKDSLHLEPDSSFINFYPNSDVDKIIKKLQIHQKGNYSTKLKLINTPKYFNLLSTAYSDSLINLSIEFIGGYGYDSYTDSLVFTDDCNQVLVIELFAFPDKYKSIAQVEKNIYIDSLICEDRFIYKLNIKNLGNLNLNIEKIELINNTIGIQIPDVNNVTINQAESYLVLIDFNFNISTEFIDTLKIYSNADNFENGIINIPMNIKQNLPNYSFSENNKLLENQKANEEIDFNILLYNQSNIPIHQRFTNTNTLFEYTFDGNNVINPNDSILIIGKFLGNDIGTSNVDELTYIDTCGNEIVCKIEINIINDEHLQIFVSDPIPNPTLDQITKFEIVSNKDFSYKYRLYDNIGRIVLSLNYTNQTQREATIFLNLQNVAIGVYLIEIETNYGIFLRKIIKLK